MIFPFYLHFVWRSRRPAPRAGIRHAQPPVQRDLGCRRRRPRRGRRCRRCRQRRWRCRCRRSWMAERDKHLGFIGGIWIGANIWQTLGQTSGYMIFSLGKTSGFHGTNVCQYLRKSNDLGYIDAEAPGWRWKDKLGVWGYHGDKYGLKGVEACKNWLVGLYRHLAMTQWHDIFLRRFFKVNG